MKIILVDNYDRGYIQPTVIAYGVREEIARRIVDLLNEEEGEFSPRYYMIKPDDWKWECND